MLGNLMMLAFGCNVSLPNSARLLGTFCASVRYSGNSPRMRAATEMSQGITSISACAAKLRTSGKNAAVASIGASSVWV